MRIATRRRTAVSVQRLALVACLLAPIGASAQGACANWVLPAEWQIVQSNADEPTIITSKNGPNGFTGTGSYFYWHRGDVFSGDSPYQEKGTLVGTLKGSDFEMTIYWNNHTTGVYTARIGPQGLAVGETHALNDPATRADWHAVVPFACADSATAAAPPPPTAKPPIKLGRVDTSKAPVTAPVSICETARSARARNSPAAPGLERQCAAQTAAAAVVQAAPPAPVAAPVAVPLPVLDQAWRDEKAARGEVLVSEDPLGLAPLIRSQWTNANRLAAFNIGMAVTEGQTLPGPGKQAILNAMPEQERRAFGIAMAYSIDRNAHLELAKTGAAMVAVNTELGGARSRVSNPLYWLGFDIASGIFGDPSLGAQGKTEMGPGSAAIRNGLQSADAQKGFDAAFAYHKTKSYH